MVFYTTADPINELSSNYCYLWVHIYGYKNLSRTKLFSNQKSACCKAMTIRKSIDKLVAGKNVKEKEKSIGKLDLSAWMKRINGQHRKNGEDVKNVG